MSCRFASHKKIAYFLEFLRHQISCRLYVGMFKREKKRKPKEIRKGLRLYCSSYMMYHTKPG
uniref:Putative ovule protein n=1 Tax=Solanum chacoense TaxID=4108 RepID=A0A0V0GSB5_SOLCH